MSRHALLKKLALARIDSHRDEIIDLVRRIHAEPETGYREHLTAAAVSEMFHRLDVPHECGLAVTGVKGELRGSAGAGPAVAIIGELDALIVPDHVDAHPQRQAAHACGHNGQIGSMVGAVIGLQADGVLDQLCGRVVPMAVPAEECIDVEGRLEMRRNGRIEFLLGKAELIRVGAFDDVDMAMLVHTSNRDADRFGLGRTSNGALVKRAQFIGRAAHAGGRPERGINALDAARLALTAIDAQRATFRDDDNVRVHPIITAGGEATSTVPADVRIETFVRARTLEAIADANAKVDRALRAGALAMGATVRITTVPGYLPMTQDGNLVQLFADNAATLVGAGNVNAGLGHTTASTDMGDLSMLMPVVHPHATGATGIGHGADYRVVDVDNAVINAAKAMAMTVIDLLADRAGEAQRVKAEFAPRFTKDSYLEYVRNLACEHEHSNGE